MNGAGPDTEAGGYPRDLTPMERSLIEWVLPAGSPGYRRYREFVAEAAVIGQGRRGEGEIILGRRGTAPDFGSPLGPVFSFGEAATGADVVSVTVRELTDDQVSVEIVGRKTDAVPEEITVARKWTYADWKPGSPCPQCAAAVREVAVGGRPRSGATGHTIAFCAADRRLWVYDAAGITCRPVPLTNYYNELMLLKNIRDPAIALDGKKLFDDIARYTDGELAGAFLAYNRLKIKIPDIGPGAAPAPEAGGIIRKLLGKLTG